MSLDIEKEFKATGDGVVEGKKDLSRYFHSPDLTLAQKFNFIYKLFRLTDTDVAHEIGIDRSTMGRYRRGVFQPAPEIKLKIAQAISKLAGYQVDSCVLFGDDLFFDDFKETTE